MSRRRRAAGGGGAAMEELTLRRGPWTPEEDDLLVSCIACHGEGRWNLLARSSGLKRTGKSCRLRWLNYLKPDVRRGNMSPEEQLMILELHSRWGNRWSRIAQHLPGRTDNEIKNYWRTRVQKQARQLNVDAGSAVFRDAVRCLWAPRLLEKVASPQACLRQQLAHGGGCGGGGVMSSFSPMMISCRQQETPTPMDVRSCLLCYPVVDPTPGTSTSTAAAPLPPPVPCFSEPCWDQYYPGEFDGAGDVFDSTLLGSTSLDLDVLDLGPAAAECCYSADSTLLDYLTSSRCTAAAMTTMLMSSGGGAAAAMVDGDHGSSMKLGEL